eukprot:jgi/Tetstr1/437610/TSEL_026277.t1
MLARFEDAGVEFTPSTWAVAYADHVARCSGGDSNHAAHEWAAHGLSDICHDVKSALGVGVQILTEPSVLVSLPKGSDGRPADVGLFGYGGIRGNTVAVDTTIAPILGVSTPDPTTALRAAERHKIQKYDEGVRNAAGMLRFVPFAVSEFGSLAPHAEAFLVELAKASQAHTGKNIGQLLSAWRRRFSLLINMAHADNVLGGVAAARVARDGTQPANPAGTPAPEGGEQGAQEPLPAELDAPDNELEYVDFAYYGRVIPPGLERPPRDVDEPRLWTLTDDTARALADKRSQAAYDDYLHLGCYAFFSSCANEAMRGALESLSTESATPAIKAAALAELRACYRTHLATEEATRSRLGYLQLAKNGPTATEADRVFAELAHAKFCTPRRIAVSGQLDQLRRAFDDKTLEISLSAAGKARAAAAFAKATPDKPAPTESAERRKQREQAAAARKAAATAAASDKAKAKVTK